MKNIPILLTATIKPHVTNGIFPINQSEEERYEQYKYTLTYLHESSLFNKIIFADNSSSPFISGIRYHAQLLSKRGMTVKVFSFPIKNEWEVSGKGCGEGYLISEVIEKYKNFDSFDSFFKLTGRYKVHNLYRIIPSIKKALKENSDLQFICCNFKNYSKGIYTVSSAFFWTRRKFWERYLIDSYKVVDDKNGLAYEAVMGTKINELVNKGISIGEMILPLIIEAKNTKNDEFFLPKKDILLQNIKSYVAHHLKPLKSVRILSGENNYR